MPVVDLTVDRNLLCPNFDGYKLSFDAVPVLRQNLDRKPLKLEPHVNQYSLLHAELFGKHNMLFADPWARYNSYYINISHQLVLCSYDEMSGQPRPQRVVFTIDRKDHGDGYQQQAGDYNYTVRFISEKYCVICDGMLTLHLLDTGDRMRNAEWQLIHRTPVAINTSYRGFVLYDARLDIFQERKQISLVAGHVDRGENDRHIMILFWSRWTLSSLPDGKWNYVQCEQLETPGSIYYCAFEPRAESLIICTNKQIQTSADKIREAAVREQDQKQTNHNEGEQLAYSWTQTDVNVILHFAVAEDMQLRDYDINCTKHRVVIKCQEQTLLDGILYAAVDEQLTNWSLVTKELQITLIKLQAEHWPRLLNENQELSVQEQNEMEADVEPNLERLPIPNLEEPIEECDFPVPSSEEDIKMIRYNLAKEMITHTIFMGPIPPLFVSSLRAGYPAAFVTRQGVDASVWLQLYQPAKPNEWSVRHEGNLHAFGYVQASKEQRKFIDCCPQLDYAVIAESYRHIFIYKPRNSSAEGLRNRNGPQVVIGKQNLVTLDDDLGEVLGLATAPNVITILTEHALLHLQV